MIRLRPPHAGSLRELYVYFAGYHSALRATHMNRARYESDESRSLHVTFARNAHKEVMRTKKALSTWAT